MQGGFVRERPPGTCGTSPKPVVTHTACAEFARDGFVMLFVAQSAGDDHVVTAGANCLVLAELGGTNNGFADVQQLAIPPHLFGRSAAADSRPQSLNQLFAI